MRYLLILLLLHLAFAISTRTFLEFEQPIGVPLGWRERPDLLVSNFQERKLVLALKQSNVDQLDSLFNRVSDPMSPQYGKYVSVAELTELIAPSKLTLSVVARWLSSFDSNLSNLTLNRDFAGIVLPIRVIEKVFSCHFSFFEHQSGKVILTSLGPYSVPSKVGEHLDYVSGIVGFPREKTTKRKNGRPETEEDEEEKKDITPEVIRKRYNVTEGQLCTNSNSSSAVAEFGDNYSPKDLKEFFRRFVTVGSSFDAVSKVVGPNDRSSPGDEASLDIQYLMGVAPNASSWFIQFEKGDNFWNDVNDWLVYLSNTTGVPWVHSVSWGSSQFAGGFPSKKYRDRHEKEYQKLGARGVTVLIASGDNGVGCDADKCRFLDDYPASSQFVTSVGATAFLKGNSGPERAVNYQGSFTSGGGFSWLFDRPSYQNLSVSYYLDHVSRLPPNSSFNPFGRATPDFSALGSEEYNVVIDKEVFLIGGTSASTPTFAAIVTLLNDARLNRGLPTLGFLNPLFYKIAAETPAAFFDVVVGNNFWPCDCSPGMNGFLCSKGWDPATGYGTPNFKVLVEEIMKY